MKGGWRHGSSGRVPAQEMRTSEFKPQYCQKIKKMVLYSDQFIEMVYINGAYELNIPRIPPKQEN
jgi:hypothetical protein